jgi:hypothetical protein
VRTVADAGPARRSATWHGGGPGSGGTDPASVLTKLLTGENQLRVWVGGPEQQRVSLLDDFAELDVVRDGDELWTYSSSDDTATFYDLAAEAEAALRRPSTSPRPTRGRRAGRELAEAEARAPPTSRPPTPG